MKNKIIYLFGWTIAFFAMLTSSNAQNSAPKFTGKFEYPITGIFDSIDFRNMKENILWGVKLIPHIVSIKGAHFSCEMPFIKDPTLVQINFIKMGKYVHQPGEYFMEPGDNINIRLLKVSEKDSLVFTGRGSAKYNLIEKLRPQEEKFLSLKKELIVAKTNQDLKILLSDYAFLVKRFINEQTDIIENYPDVNDNIKKLIGYQFGPFQNHYWVNTLLNLYFYNKNFANQQSREIIKDAFNKWLPLFDNPDTISVLSPLYYASLMRSLKAKMIINSEPTDVLSFYKRLKDNYDGIVEQRLLVEFFVGNSRMSDLTNYTADIFDKIVIDAEKSVSNEYYKNLITVKTRSRKGAKVIDGDFFDLNGNDFSLNSMKGKVVFIHGWARGCTGCALFHTTFEDSIHPHFSNNPDFQVISLNTDRLHQRWTDGLNSGKFSSKGYLNIGVGKLGIDHPFVNYYTNAMPFLLLIDKEGLIVTQLNGTEDPKSIVKLIKEALDKKAKIN